MDICWPLLLSFEKRFPNGEGVRHHGSVYSIAGQREIVGTVIYPLWAAKNPSVGRHLHYWAFFG